VALGAVEAFDAALIEPCARHARDGGCAAG
jgi:hypothetical protein